MLQKDKKKKTFEKKQNISQFFKKKTALILSLKFMLCPI